VIAERHPDLDLLALARTGPVHFIGVAGAGMSALAELVHRSGGRVTGCDLHPGVVGETLRRHGIEVLEGHDPTHVEDAVAVVVTAAVPGDEPELEAARARGVPVLKRAAALGTLVGGGRVAAVAGTHGKTTTTAMLALALEAAGLDPTAFVGGRVEAWDGGLRGGAGDLFVVEADEFDRSFLSLRPETAVLTSLEADHLDSFGSLESLEDAFLAFLGAVPSHGLVTACTDDAGVRRILDRVDAPVLGYGLGPEAALQAAELAVTDRGSDFVVLQDGATLGRLRLAVPGRHNVRNALGALAAARHMGAAFPDVVAALAEFGGVARRFQELGSADGVTVVDDYAHHPTEIRATLAAARQRYPERPLVAAFQPHLYSRTRDLHEAFGRALAEADGVWVTDVYPAREPPIPGVTGELVARAADAAGAPTRYHPDVDDLPEALLMALRPGDVCIVMGAGDVDRAARKLLELLGHGPGGD